MPTIAVLSDLHGNHPALLTCLAHARAHGAEQYWFLGDYLGEMAHPRRTLATLYALKEQETCLFLRGNKENYWLDRRGGADTIPWKRGDSTTGMLAYNYDNLTDEDLDWFASLPIARRVELPGLPPLMLCHGSPTSANKALYPHPDTEVLVADFADEYTVCGHSHRQYALVYGRKTLWNPGSVGVHVGSAMKTQYMLLHGEDGVWTPKFFSLAYDVEETLRQMEEEDLYSIAPGWARATANLLRRGTPTNAAVLKRAMAFCEAEEGACTWPNIPEKYWRQAVEEL